MYSSATGVHNVKARVATRENLILCVCAGVQSEPLDWGGRRKMLHSQYTDDKTCFMDYNTKTQLYNSYNKIN